MSECIDVSAILTVTLHDDGRVSWSPADAPRGEVGDHTLGVMMREEARWAKRRAELDRVLDALKLED